MMSRLLRGFYFFLIFYLTSCAIQVAPQGGERDSKPPTLRSIDPPSGTTNFDRHDIVFDFDENIAVKDVATKLVISPPLEHQPLAKVRKNKLTLTVEDTLRPATTYSFNFGDAVSDLNEGNVFQDLSYVVSTGSIIDTLSFSGKVIRSENLLAEKGMLVLLYSEFATDSAPYLERPLYFSRTKEDGSFSIRNLAPGWYKAFCLMDADGNYRYNDPAERIAFIEKPFPVPDSDRTLSSFLSPDKLKLIRSTADGPGKAILVFNRPMDGTAIQFLGDTTKLQVREVEYSSKRDSVTYWYTALTEDTLALSLRFEDRVDTVTVRLIKKDAPSLRRNPFKLKVAFPDAATGVLPPFKMLSLLTNHPITSVDTSKMTLLSSGHRIPLRYTARGRIFEFPVVWEEEKEYVFRMYPGAFTDVFGLTNDSAEVPFRIASATDYGSLRISTGGLSSGSSFVLQLVDGQEQAIAEMRFQGDTSFVFEHLIPGTYRLKLIEDTNGNGKWDGGNNLQHLQPETVRYYKDPVVVRANWDVEVVWR